MKGDDRRVRVIEIVARVVMEEKRKEKMAVVGNRKREVNSFFNFWSGCNEWHGL